MVRNKKYNIKDVAKETGVSTSTISNYVNKSAPVNKITGLKIESAIKKLNYFPDNIARGLRIGKTRSIAVIFPEIADPFYSAILNGIEEVATKNDYIAIIVCNNYDIKIEEKQVKNLLSNYVSGFIYATGGLDKKILSQVLEQGIPLVTIDRKVSNKKVFSVEVNNFTSYYKATNYLIKKGHRDICYISEPIIMPILNDRLEGFKKAFEDNGIKFDKSKIYIDKNLQTQKVEGGYNIMVNILKSGYKPDAVIGTADAIIIGTMKAALDLGYKIPDDISFMGNNDTYLSKFMNPSLTTISQPKREMGKIAMELLIDIIRGKMPERRKILLETNIIERESVKSKV